MPTIFLAAIVIGSLGLVIIAVEVIKYNIMEK